MQTNRNKIGDFLKLQKCETSIAAHHVAFSALTFGWSMPFFGGALKSVYDRQKWDIVGNTIRPAYDSSACVKLDAQGYLVFQSGCDKVEAPHYYFVFTPVK